MDNNSNTTNNVNNEFTTTTSNEVEITPSMLQAVMLTSELNDAKAELQQLKQSLQIQREVQNDLRCAMADSVYHLLKHLDADVIADTICRLNTTKESQIIKYMANTHPNIIKAGLKESDNAEQFSTDIDNLDDYISDKYDEGDIIGLIDDKYSWSNLLDRAFSRGSIDNSDVVDHIDTEDIVNDYLRGGNMDFSDVMHHFDESDCFSYLSDEGRISWENVKDYVDMDDVKADIEFDNDMVGEYISNLNDSEFRNLVTNLS
jgi:hypothetical protein